MKKKSKSKNSGQSLVEVLIALAIVTLVILALVRLTVTSIRNADFAKKQTQASQFAQEGMENIRSLRDAGWTNFSAMATPLGQTYGYSGSTPSGNCLSTPIPGTIFIRCVKMKQVVVNKVEVTVTVSWTDSIGVHKSELISYFSKW